MRLPHLVVVVLMVALMFWAAAAARAAETQVTGTTLQEVTVKPGETIWGVANTYLLHPERWPDLLKWNTLPSGDPNAVLPGMKITVPVLMLKEHLRAARLIRLANAVVFRRSEAPDWRPAALDLQLYREDSLRTMPQASARVLFPNNELLSLEENSLIIIRPEEKKEEAQLVRGALRASSINETQLMEGALRASRVKIITSRISVTPTTPETDYRVRRRGDTVDEVSVFRGETKVEGFGKTILVPANFMAEVDLKAGTLPQTLRPLPEPPVVPQEGAPEGGAEAPARPGSSNPAGAPDAGMVLSRTGGMTFPVRSTPTGGSARYLHLQVARDGSFRDIALDEISETLAYPNADLPDGLYHWRVASVDAQGLESGFSPARRLLVDRVPPPLEVSAPEEGSRVDDVLVHVRGKTEKGATLSIRGRPAPVDGAGGFDQAVFLRRGMNLIEVEARDRAGNISRSARRVEGLREGPVPPEASSDEEAEARRRKVRVEIDQLRKQQTVESSPAGDPQETEARRRRIRDEIQRLKALEGGTTAR